MPDTETRHMTVDEIALMREIVKWRRLHFGSWPRAEYYKQHWQTGSGDEKREVAFDLMKTDDPEDAYAIVYYCTGWYASYTKFEAKTLTESVDVLVAFGFLPARFSSSYRAGWNASYIWEHAGSEYDEFKQMFQDPENVSFPVAPYRGSL